ncbi:MAG: hemerythrin domain-containing protein [Flavobacteriales bacterium]|nr:hemerythrin domain-containing protein [Flavobacteriales bacterium]
MISIETNPLEISNYNRQTEHVFNRYNIRPYSTTKLSELTSALNIDSGFLVTILNAFNNLNEFGHEPFRHFSIPTIVDYLERSHKYYFEKRLPAIEQSARNLVSNYSHSHPLLKILHLFLHLYQKDLKEHFEMEEQLLFPYAKMLDHEIIVMQNPSRRPLEFLDYSVEQFTVAHADSEQSLADVRKAILHYNPSPDNQSPYRIMVDQLKHFEQDLHIHAKIEDLVLVPKLELLERSFNCRLN